MSGEIKITRLGPLEHGTAPKVDKDLIGSAMLRRRPDLPDSDDGSVPFEFSLLVPDTMTVADQLMVVLTLISQLEEMKAQLENEVATKGHRS